MATLNQLSIAWNDAADEDGFRWFDVVIDGVNLIDLVRPIEERILLNPSESGIAGGYGGNLLTERLAAPAGRQDDVEGVVLICDCGCLGCWDFMCMIRRENHFIRWDGFRNNHRDWNYEALGPFVFHVTQYEEALQTR